MSRSPTAGNAEGGSHWIRDAKRRRIYERDEWCCRACTTRVAGGRAMRIESVPAGVRLATLDHVLPRAAGGSNAADNLATMCEPCNRLKGDLSAVAFAFEALADGACDALARLLDRVLAPLPPVREAA